LKKQEDTVLMEHMTWREIRRSMENGKHTAILVAASMEQHGPHLPIATDTIIGYALAEGVARELGNALVAPVIRYGLSEHHVGFTGTITLPLKTFVKVVEEHCQCLRKHGFKNTVVFSSHGGNRDPLTAFIPSIAKKLSPDMRLLLVGTVGFDKNSVSRILKEYDVSPTKAGVHAGFAETSMFLAIRPDLVRVDRIEPGLVDDDFYSEENIERSKIFTYIHGIRPQSSNGILGDPTGSNEEFGKALLERKIKDLTREIRLNLHE